MYSCFDLSGQVMVSFTPNPNCCPDAIESLVELIAYASTYHQFEAYMTTEYLSSS